MERRSALSVGTNGRYGEEGVIPSGAEGGVEESVRLASLAQDKPVGKTGVPAAFVFAMWAGGPICVICGQFALGGWGP